MVWSYVTGAEEFFYLLTRCFLKYGPNIGSGLYNEAALVKRKQDFSCAPGDKNGIDYERAVKCRKRGEWEQTLPSTESVAEASTTAHQLSIIPLTSPRGPARQSSRANQDQDNEDKVRSTIRSMRTFYEEDDSILDFDEIAGLEEVKLALEEMACFFLHFPHLTHNLRHRATTGILLFGPQGTGKTLLIRSFAKKYNMALYDIPASAIMSKFVGEAEKFIRALFQEVRANAPAVLMLDECEGLLCNPANDAQQSHHYRLLQNELKNQWSNLIYSKDEVIVIGATNKPHDIDMDGFGRRLSMKLHVSLPSERACCSILKGALSRLRHSVNDDELQALAHVIYDRGLSGYDIDCVVEGLLRKAIRGITIATHFVRTTWKENTNFIPCSADVSNAVAGPWQRLGAGTDEISYCPFNADIVQAAIERARPTVDQGMLQRHVEFASQYGTDEW